MFSVTCWMEQTDKQMVPGVGGELLLQHGVLPAQGDGILVVRVSVLEGHVSLVAQVLNCLGEVCLDEVYHGFLLRVEALQSLHLTWRVRRKHSVCDRKTYILCNIWLVSYSGNIFQ